VSVESLYKDRSQKDPYHAKHDDIIAKMVTVTSKLARTKSDEHLRLEGCPVSVAEQVLALVALAKTNNPYLAADEVVRFSLGYAAWRGAMLAKRLKGQAYQVHGPCHRGEAAPDVAAPTPAGGE
jgi:hypothetical protein